MVVVMPSQFFFGFRVPTGSGVGVNAVVESAGVTE